MTSPNGNPTRRRRVQYSLAALLAVVTAVSVLLSLGRWLGWGYLALPLVALYMAGLGVVTFLPVVVLVVGWNSKTRRAIGGVIVAAGVLFIIHFVIMVLSIERLRRQPFVLDFVPFSGLMSGTLNWSVPGSAAGLLIAPLFAKRIWRTPAFWIGAALIAAAAVAFVCYGHYFFVELLDHRFADIVWWL